MSGQDLFQDSFLDHLPPPHPNQIVLGRHPILLSQCLSLSFSLNVEKINSCPQHVHPKFCPDKAEKILFDFLLKLLEEKPFGTLSIYFETIPQSRLLLGFLPWTIILSHSSHQGS